MSKKEESSVPKIDAGDSPDWQILLQLRECAVQLERIANVLEKEGIMVVTSKDE